MAVAVAAMGPATVAVSGAASGSGSVEPTVLALTPLLVIDGTGYVPVGLGDLGGDSVVHDASASGWMVGSVFDSDAGSYVAARWPSQGGGVEVLSSTPSGAMGVRDDGTAVGGANGGPVIWSTDGATLMLDTTGANDARVFSINDSGVAVGDRFDEGSDGGWFAIAWSGPDQSWVGLPDFGGGFDSAYDVNDDGAIVGMADDGSGGRAMRWSSASADPEPLLPIPDTNSYARSVTPLGAIVGVIQTNSGRRPFIRDPDGSVVLLDFGSGGEGEAENLDDDGTIVGNYRPLNPTNLVGWVFDRQAGDTRRLAGWASDVAGVDDAGRVAGELRNVPGGVQRAVRWELREVSFADVPVSSPFAGAITQLVLLGTTTGYGDGGFHPTASVSRQALAALVYRTVGWPLGNDPSCTAAPFVDVPVGSTFCGHVAWAADGGVVGGFADGLFHPSDAVSRQAAAAVLYRAMGSPSGTDPSCSSKPFTDIAVGHQFCGEIAWAKAAGVTGGFADGTFRPTAPVSRQAAAAQLAAVHDALIAAG